MKWDNFLLNADKYKNFPISRQIALLEDFGTGDEVVSMLLYMPDQKTATAFVQKALDHGVEFTYEDISEMIDDVDIKLCEKICKQLAYNYKNIDWETFCYLYDYFNGDILMYLISNLEDIGDSSEVSSIIMDMPTRKDANLLAARVIAKKKKLDRFDLEAIRYNIDDYYWEILAKISNYVVYEEPEVQEEIVTYEPSFWDLFVGYKVVESIFSHKKKKSDKCDGDCANCPDHYGYRYGRWYYGKGHNHGCERGGNTRNWRAKSC